MIISDFEQLLKKYASGACSQEEELWIENWFYEHEFQTNDSWNRLSATQKREYLLQMSQHIQDKISPINIVPFRKPRTNKWKLFAACAAAASLLLLFLGPYQIFNSISRDELIKVDWISVEVPSGGRQLIKLSDGTKVWLQSGTKFQYPTDYGKSASRNVRIEGEGYFEVSPDTSRPFIVETKFLKTRVVGTCFNIDAFPEMAFERINLIEGKLAVSNIHGKNDEINIHASQSIYIDQNEQKIVVEQMPAEQMVLNYKNGVLNFSETPLSEALYRISKSYGIIIQLDTVKALRQRITGTFQTTESIKNIMESIAQSTGGQVNWKSERILELKIN